MDCLAEEKMLRQNMPPLFLRLICILFLLSLPAACSLDRSRRAADDPPNILLILADDLGYHDVSFNGATEIRTPHIDRLAKEGVVFANGYVAHPACAPSRAGVMTGRYPARFGLELNLPYAPFDDLLGLPVEEKTFATHLQRAGYRTGMVGKWHLGAAPPFHPRQRGFDSFHGFLGGGHDYFNVDPSRSPPNEYLLPLSADYEAVGFADYLTDVFTDYAVEFIQEDRNRPFFLYLSYNAPHEPLQVPAEIVRKYRHIEDEKRRRYLAMVDALDANVGRIITALQQSGEWENTLTFFLSDNGGVAWPDQGLDWADNAPLRGGKGSLHEGGIRVPFVAVWPAEWPRGQTFEPMVISLDIAATALTLAGAVPDPELPLDGVNLDPFVRGVISDPPHEALFWRRATQQADLVYAVRATDAKLVKDDRYAEAALFDLQADAGEAHDLIRDDPGTAAELARLWNDWNAGNSANFVTDSANYWQAISEWTRHMHEGARQWWGAVCPFPSVPIQSTPVPSISFAPAPPVDFTAEGGDQRIVLRWSNPDDADITGYQFRLRSLHESAWSWGPWKDIAASGPSSTSHVLTGLREERDWDLYHVQLRALNAGGAGEPSEAIALVAAPGSGPVRSPTLPGAVTDGDGRITLTWIDPPGDAADIIGYQFRLRGLSESAWRPWRDVEGGSPMPPSPLTLRAHCLGGLTPRAWYSVQLRALYVDGSSWPVREATAE